MSDLEHRLRHALEPILEQRDPRERLSAYHDMPYAIFRYEPEEEFEPSLKAALFVLNDEAVLSRLVPKPGNLFERLGKISANGQIAVELYLSVLTRPPSAEEKSEVESYLTKHAAKRQAAIGHLAWSLLASTEFCVNH